METQQDEPRVVSLGDIESEIVERLGGRTKTVVGNTIRMFLNICAREVCAGSAVSLKPFGRFDAYVARHRERTNPFDVSRTIPAKTEVKVRFKAGGPLHKKAQRLLGEVAS